MSSYEVIIGLEVHAQLRTQTKLFCGCATAFGATPNTQTCPVCLGLPGALPVLNTQAVSMAILTGLALNGSIIPVNQFARKHYFYPDLPKGYQISQFELPLCRDGWIDVPVNESMHRVRIRRAHLEEDAGKSIHVAGSRHSRVDMNRCGVPLLEIVTEPDLRSSDEAVAALKALRDILVYLDVCDGNMEQGSFRCEPNVSLRPAGQEPLGTKVELKNINSFKFAKHAIEYEVQRQERVLDAGRRVNQETRLWDVEHGMTVVMRSKEEAHDYRYCPDPDLRPLCISQDWIKEVRSALPELPQEKRRRFESQYELPSTATGVLTASRSLADYFEACVSRFPQPKIVSHWVMGDLQRALNEEHRDAADSKMTPERLAALLRLVDDGTISLKTAREIFPELYQSQQDPRDFIHARGLIQISNDQALERMIDEVLANSPEQRAQYRSGKESLLGFFIGQVMKASKGKANPQKVNALLRQRLASQQVGS